MVFSSQIEGEEKGRERERLSEKDTGSGVYILLLSAE